MKIDSFFHQQEFKKCEVEYGVYVKYTNEGNMILVCIYVDDMLLTGSCLAKIQNQRDFDEFEMTDLRKVVYFLGMEFLYTSKGIILHQLKYAIEVLKRFEMFDCKPAITPAESNQKLDADEEGEDVDATVFKQLVGSLRYLCNTRPDICYSVGVISRFMSKPKVSHYQQIELVN